VLRPRYALGAVPFAHRSLLNASLEVQTSVLYVFCHLVNELRKLQLSGAREGPPRFFSYHERRSAAFSVGLSNPYRETLFAQWGGDKEF
jgi:hypothetical protein